MPELVLRLDDATLNLRGFAGLQVAEMHEIVIISELAGWGPEADPANWVSPAACESKILRQVALNRYAFCGAVQQSWQPRPHDEPVQYALLDCQPAFTLACLQDEAPALEAGRSLAGMVDLRLSWADLQEAPLCEVIPVTISGLQRLIMQPGPDFGQLVSLDSLPPAPLGSDQLYLTVQTISGLRLSPPPTP